MCSCVDVLPRLVAGRECREECAENIERRSCGFRVSSSPGFFLSLLFAFIFTCLYVCLLTCISICLHAYIHTYVLYRHIFYFSEYFMSKAVVK